MGAMITAIAVIVIIWVQSWSDDSTQVWDQIMETLNKVNKESSSKAAKVNLCLRHQRQSWWLDCNQYEKDDYSNLLMTMLVAFQTVPTISFLACQHKKPATSTVASPWKKFVHSFGDKMHALPVDSKSESWWRCVWSQYCHILWSQA